VGDHRVVLKSTLGIQTPTERVTTFSTIARHAYRMPFDIAVAKIELKGYR
jgi:hypothetical protein